MVLLASQAESAPVVGDREDDFAVSLCQKDLNVVRTSVLVRVVQRFLHDTVKIRLDVRREACARKSGG